MFTVRDYFEKVRPRLDRVFSSELSDLLGNLPARDRTSLVTSLEAGKKIRGCLCCMINDAMGGRPESAIPRAVAVELIQAATLVHDDFVDQDAFRRNRPAVWTLEGARRAVLIGDVIFATAIERMSDLSREDGAAISHAIAQVSQGALHEPLEPRMLAREIETRRVSDRIYDKIIHLKTGILFGTACRLGAIAAQGNEEQQEVSYRYGLRIGEAYQIADDLKEVRQHLLSRSIDPKQMVALAPAFLYFEKETHPRVLPLLKESTDLDELALGFFRATAGLMEDEVELRLRSAVSEIEEHFPADGFAELLRKAPGEIIRMFNES
jgi:geranylgeranyl pyrophosphate synthase